MQRAERPIQNKGTETDRSSFRRDSTESRALRRRVRENLTTGAGAAAMALALLIAAALHGGRAECRAGLSARVRGRDRESQPQRLHHTDDRAEFRIALGAQSLVEAFVG